MSLPVIRSDVLLISKASSWPMVVLGWIVGDDFMTRWWTTYRLPFQRKVRITYPALIVIPELHADTIRHEYVHADQFLKWWGPWLIPLLYVLIPLPTFLSGRWWIERGAYLVDIRAKCLTVEESVQILWKDYGWCWPRRWMRTWFARQLAEKADVAV